MYSKELEELIDSAIADGVITEQECAALRKRALLCGEDPDEVMIIVEGRLAKIKKTVKPANGKHGSIVKCPNCGTVVEYGNVKCPECGYAFSGIEGSSSAKELQRQIDAVLAEKNLLGGALSLLDLKKQERINNIIKNFPVPNTKEDLLEFMFLCISHMKPESESGSDNGAAWNAKAFQVKKKVEMMLKGDPDADNLLNEMNSKINKNKRKSIKSNIFLGILFIVLFGGMFGGAAWMVISKNAEVENTYKDMKHYSDSLTTCINKLPSPTAGNYMDCARAFMAVSWDRTFTNPASSSSDKEEFEKNLLEMRRAFYKKKQTYAYLVKSAMKRAGVADEDIPVEFKDAENFWTINATAPSTEKEGAEETTDSAPSDITPDKTDADNVETEGGE